MDSLDATFRPVVASAASETVAAPSVGRGRINLSGIGRASWRMAKRWRRPLIPMAILLGSAVAYWTLTVTKPEVQREAKPEQVWAVDTVVAYRTDHQPTIQLLGTVAAGRWVDLRALVAGTVEEVSPVLNDGGVVREGELLMTIEPLDYELTVVETRAQLDEAKARLDEFRANVEAEEAKVALARQQLELRRRELTRNQELFKKGAIAAPRLEQTQLTVAQEEQTFTAAENNWRAMEARVRQQEAVVERLGAALRKAETDLQRTRLVAPFDAFVGNVNAERGMRIGPSDRVATLSGTTALEAQVTLPTDAYGRLASDGQGILGRPAEVVWNLGGTQLSYPAHVERVIDRIDTAAGGVGIYVRLDGNFVDAPLRPGAFVQVKVPDRTYQSVVQLPPTALHGEDRVYVINAENRLDIRTVQVVSRDGGAVYIGAGLEDGDKVVTTRFQEIGPGLKVSIRGEATSPEGAGSTGQSVEGGK